MLRVSGRCWDQRTGQIRPVDVQFLQRALLRRQVDGDRVCHAGLRHVGWGDADRNNQPTIQVAQHVALVPIDQQTPTLTAMAHLRLFDTHAPIFGDAVPQGGGPIGSCGEVLGAHLLRHCQTGDGAGGGVLLEGLGVEPLLNGREAVKEHGQRLLTGTRVIPVQIQSGFQARSGDQRCPRFIRYRAQPPPLLTRHHAQSLAQGMTQQIRGIFHPSSAPQRATVQRRPQLAGAKGTTGGGDLHRPFQQTAVELPGDQPLTKGNEGAFPEGRGIAVQTVQHQLPPAIHGGGFDHFVIGDLRVGLEQGRQRQLGGGTGGGPCGGSL